MKSGKLNFLEPSGPLQACNGTALPLHLPLTLSGEIISVYSENPTEHINIFRGQIADNSNVRADGIYSYHCALNA